MNFTVYILQWNNLEEKFINTYTFKQLQKCFEVQILITVIRRLLKTSVDECGSKHVLQVSADHAYGISSGERGPGNKFIIRSLEGENNIV